MKRLLWILVLCVLSGESWADIGYKGDGSAGSANTTISTRYMFGSGISDGSDEGKTSDSLKFHIFAVMGGDMPFTIVGLLYEGVDQKVTNLVAYTTDSVSITSTTDTGWHALTEWTSHSLEGNKEYFVGIIVLDDCQGGRVQLTYESDAGVSHYTTFCDSIYTCADSLTWAPPRDSIPEQEYISTRDTWIHIVTKEPDTPEPPKFTRRRRLQYGP